MSSMQKREVTTFPATLASLEAAFAEAPLAIGHAAPDGRWLRVNRRLCELLDRDSVALAAGKLGDALHPDDRHADDESRRHLLGGEFRRYTAERRFLRGDGRVFRGTQSVSLVRDAQGTPLFLVIILQEAADPIPDETASERSRQMLRALVDHADTPIYACDDDQRFVLVNRAYAQLFGVTPQAMVGERRTAFMSPASATAFEDNERCVQLGGVARRFEEILLREDGVHTFLTTRFPIRNPQGNIVAVGGVSTDVTVTARQQAALRVSEVRFRAFFDAAMVGMATIGAGREWLQVNPAFCQILGYPPEELLATDWLDLLHADDRGAALDNFAQFLAGTLTTLSVEVRFVRKNNTVARTLLAARAVPAIDGPLDFLAVIIEDISDRKAAERMLQEQLEFSNCLLTASPMGILTYLESGQCLYANEAAARITGGSIGRLVQQNFRDLPAWRNSGLYEAAVDVLERGGSAVLTVHHHSSFDRDLWMDCTMSTFLARGQRHLLMIINDVTERRRAQQCVEENLRALRETNRKLEEAHHQLLQAEKMASIGQLAAGVAHELNNPIGFVYSNLGSLARYVDDLLQVDHAFAAVEKAMGEALQEAFAPVHALKEACDYTFLVTDLRHLIAESLEGLERVRKIVQDLKDFSRAGDSGWQWANLHQGLESTLNIVWNELKYKAEVQRHYGELPEVRCIPSQLNQVFLNLLVNAAQAIEERGHIVIRTGRDDGKVWVEVEDDGQGISPEHRQRIFEPFFTTKPVGKGTGLGLSVSWGIVQRHHGTMVVRPAGGQGSIFRVTLPIDASAMITTEEQEAR